MKFSIQQTVLRSALRSVTPAVAAKSSLPILANIKIAVTDSGVIFSATNLNIGIEQYISLVNGIEIGSITLPAKLLSETVAGLPTGHDVTIETLDNDRVRVSSGRNAVTIAGIDADEFPTIPVANGATVSMPFGLLQRIISAVAYAAAADDSRPVLAGVLLRCRPGEMFAAAADGFRLAMARYPAKDDVRLELIIPAQSLIELGKVAAQAHSNVDITVNDGGQQVVFGIGATKLVSRLIDGRFPDVERIEPRGAARDNSTRMVVPVDLLKDALKLTKPFAASTQNALRLSVASNTLTLSTPENTTGQANVEVGVQTSGATENRTNLNQLYLAELLSTVPASEMAIEIIDGQAPFLTRYTTDGLEVINIIMPMAVK